MYESIIESILKKNSSIKEDLIPGGLADNKPESSFDKDELSKGVKVELEHTNSKDLAKEIAKDHLTEDPKYYSKLEKIEDGH